MLYDLKKQTDRSRAQRRFDQLLVEGVIIELTKKEKRSLSQNNYLHLILGWFGMELGYTLEEAKQIYKDISPMIFYYEKHGIRFIRSSADLTTAEMTKSIDKFRDHSSQEAGIYLPEPGDQVFLKEIEIEISRNNYL